MTALTGGLIRETMGFMLNAHNSTQSTLKPRAVIVETAHSPNARLQSVPMDAVQLRDDFWQPRRERNRDVTLPSQWEHCRSNGYFDNFERAAGIKDIDFQGLHWNDSDVYKWLEAASWTLALDESPTLRAKVNDVAAQIEAMQQPDGYLHSYFVSDKAEQRFTWLEQSHELYCIGHFIQAAVAHFRATREDQLVNVARRVGDFLHQTFGPGENQLHLTDGHQEIEMALVELSRATGEPKYFETARYLTEIRARGGVQPIAHLDHLGLAYHQSQQPLEDQSEAVGHAVRALYYFCAGTDVVLEGDTKYKAALHRLWSDVTTRKMYITGGVGARHDGEAFGGAYELPNAAAYCETCAAIGLVMWAHRMLLLEGEARYADVMERALYNGALSSLSLDGTKYFYVNPLENDGNYRRREWFGCACCPPNIARLLAQLPGYFFSTSNDAIYVHLYAQGAATIDIGDGQNVTLNIRTNYPWGGEVGITVAKTRAQSIWELHLRVPHWCENAHLTINGEQASYKAENGYAIIAREWRAGDKVLWALPMHARFIEANPRVAENCNCVAIERGPLVYCIEACDHKFDISEVAIATDAAIKGQWRDDLLGGILTLQTDAIQQSSLSDWRDELYRPARDRTGPKVLLTAIPYFAWANREAGAMRVWIPRS